MVKEAEANADADKRRREQVEARNSTEAMIHQVEKTLRDDADKVPADAKADAEGAIAGARTALEGTDADAIKTAGDKLTQVAMKIGEAMYKAQAEAGAAPGGPDQGPGGHGPGGHAPGGHAPGGKPDDKVVDAEFEEVDDKNKKS